MNTNGTGSTLDMEVMLNTLTADLGASQQEDQRVTGARVRAQSERIQEKRRERLDNLQEQIRGAAGSGGCLKFLVGVFKIFDLLTKPISAITGGQLKLELGKILEQLQMAKGENRLMGLKIDGKELQNTLQGLKNLVQEDLGRMREGEAWNSRETQRVLRILEEIHDGFRSTLNT